MKKTNKKPLIALLALAVVGVVGGTFAYFTNEATFENKFQTSIYKTEATETFSAPTDWKPGDITPKTVVVTNKGDVPVAVRVSYTEKWVAADGTTELPLQDNGKDVAVINFANEADWTKSGNYYYYKNKAALAKDASTTSFIESVTYNSEIVPEMDCTTTTGTGTKTVTCQPAEGSYAGATYTLSIKVETLQQDAAATVWA